MFFYFQTAFRIRGLSRKRLEKLKSNNISLLENGMLNIPQQGWNSLHLLTLFTVKGSNLLTKQEVRNLKPLSISGNHENIISFLSSFLAKIYTIERVPCETGSLGSRIWFC